MKVIQQNFLPEDLAPILLQNKIKGTIAVQADQSEDETKFLLTLSGENDFIKGVVGWIDLKANNVRDRLSHFSQFKKLKGFRHIVQAEADEFLDQANFLTGIRMLDEFKFTYDVLIYSRQLPEAIQFVKKFP